MNISNTIATRISNWNRNRKWSLFMDIFKPAPETKVLDAGYIDIESKASDNYIEKHYPYPQNLTALGIEEPVHFHANYPDIKTVRYGGRIFPFMDKEFDICYSSAVIEHVGNRESQLEFLKEIRRVSKKAFITTPNRNFPVEVHTRIPLLHFLPKKIFDAFLKMIGKEWATGDYMNLLTYKEIESLLIDAGIEDYKIVKNRFLFFVMDYAIIINSKLKIKIENYNLKCKIFYNMDKISNKPKNSVIAVTYRCNSRCKMCNIWQIEHGEELSPDVYRKLPAGMDEVNITGGEPFLRSDLVEIVDIIYETCQPKKLVIPTNGFLQDVIIEKAKLFLTKPYKDILTIAVSLDGIGEKHSEIRGIGNAFEKSVGTVKKLLGIGFKNTGFGFTFIPGNEEEYEKVYGLSKELGVNIGVSIAHNSENYFSTDSNEGIDAKKVDEQLSRTIKEKVKTFSKNELGKSFYMHGLIRFANSKEMILPCQAMTDSFFLDPKGDIYPCNILNDRVGNLKEKSFDEIWNSKEAEQARAKAKNCRQKCWMVCTAKPAIKKHWFRTGLWILKEKFKTLRIT